MVRLIVLRLMRALTRFASYLLLGNDNLTRECIVSIWNWMIQEADTADYLSNFDHLIKYVGGITIELLAVGHLVAGAHSHHLAILEHDLIDRLVQHVGATIDSTQPGETLRQLAQSVQWVQIGTLAIANQRFVVQLHPIDQIQTWLLQVAKRM